MDAELKRYLDGVVGVVVATNFEMFMLWTENSRRPELHRLDWPSRSEAGIGHEMGKVGKHSVYCTLWPRTIDGYRILFVEPTSRVVDHGVIGDWLQENLPVTAFEDCDPRKRINMSDPNNFTNVFGEPRRRAERAANKELGL